MEKFEPGIIYNMKKLNRVFAFLSILFLLTVFWIFLDDYIRPWKVVQIKGMNINKQKLQKKYEESLKNIDKEKLANLEKRLEESKNIINSREKQIEQIKSELSEVNRKIKAETIVRGTLNSLVSATAFKYEQEHLKNTKKAPKLLKLLKKYKVKFNTSREVIKKLEFSLKEKKRQLSELNKEYNEAKSQINKLTQSKTLLKKSIKSSSMGAIFAIRNAPFIDYLDPTIKIKQVVLNNITDDRYFRHVPKVDRCMTCHVFIDKPGYENQANPYKTHPKLNLMVGKDSPHPMKSYGCTSCHGGEGHRVLDFNAAAHTPRDKKQKEEWVKKYNWHEPHKIPQPMYKVGHTEAGCIKCHGSVEFIPEANIVNKGRMVIEKYGCYGCHKIKGWEHKRKSAPSLERVTSKVDKEFFKNWVWNPKSFNPKSKMPVYFSQDNNSRSDLMKRNIVEVNAMAEYIWDKSKSYSPFSKYKPGNADRGKKLISEIGCMGCHGVEGLEEQSDKVNAYAGTYLTAIGSKIKDKNWLVSWLKKPSHYQKDTIMPSFRLTDKEANDIATYLISLKNKPFEELKFPNIDNKIRDELLLEYLSSFDTKEVAMRKLEGMSNHQRNIDLGRRSINKYGCYSCHTISGFENTPPIGAELTNIGSKPLTQFGFGHQHDIGHSRHDWIKAHVLNPRRWDGGIEKDFKDLLKMPRSYMSDQEAEAVTVALIGQVSDYIPLSGIKRLNHREKIVEKGMKILNKYNCIGCHSVDGFRGDILAMYEDDMNEGPPRLVGQGHRVNTDWFYKFLGNVTTIRPWLKVRMPSFNLSNKETNDIITSFQFKSDQVTFEEAHKIVWNPGEKLAARKLFKSLACDSCHTTGFNRDTPSAPSLYLSNKRLRASWIKKWLRNPQAIIETTPMPNFWPDNEPIDATILGGDSNKQIDALTKYVLELGKK